MKTKTVQIADVQQKSESGEWKTIISDGVITQEGTHFSKIWNWKERDSGGRPDEAEAFPHQSKHTRVVFKGAGKFVDGKVEQA